MQLSPVFAFVKSVVTEHFPLTRAPTFSYSPDISPTPLHHLSVVRFFSNCPAPLSGIEFSCILLYCNFTAIFCSPSSSVSLSVSVRLLVPLPLQGTFGELPPPAADQLGVVRSCAYHLLNMINQLRDCLRMLHGGEPDGSFGRVQLSNPIEEVKDSLDEGGSWRW